MYAIFKCVVNEWLISYISFGKVVAFVHNIWREEKNSAFEYEFFCIFDRQLDCYQVCTMPCTHAHRECSMNCSRLLVMVLCGAFDDAVWSCFLHCLDVQTQFSVNSWLSREYTDIYYSSHKCSVRCLIFTTINSHTWAIFGTNTHTQTKKTINKMHSTKFQD